MILPALYIANVKSIREARVGEELAIGPGTLLTHPRALDSWGKGVCLSILLIKVKGFTLYLW